MGCPRQGSQHRQPDVKSTASIQPMSKKRQDRTTTACTDCASSQTLISRNWAVANYPGHGFGCRPVASPEGATECRRPSARQLGDAPNQGAVPWRTAVGPLCSIVLWIALSVCQPTPQRRSATCTLRGRPVFRVICSTTRCLHAFVPLALWCCSAERRSGSRGFAVGSRRFVSGEINVGKSPWPPATARAWTPRVQR